MRSQCLKIIRLSFSPFAQNQDNLMSCPDFLNAPVLAFASLTLLMEKIVGSHQKENSPMKGIAP